MDQRELEKARSLRLWDIRLVVGYVVLFTKAVKLFRFLLAGHADHSWEKRTKKYLAPDVLIIDDFALSTLNSTQAQKNDLTECATIEDLTIMKGRETLRNQALTILKGFFDSLSRNRAFPKIGCSASFNWVVAFITKLES